MDEENKSAAAIAKGKVKLLLDKGSSEKHDLGLADTKKEPSLAEEQLMEVGSAFFHANFFSLFVSMLTGLLSLMFVPGIVTILHFTGKSDTPTLSFRRYLATLCHTTAWYEGLPRLRSSLKRVLGAHRSADFKARSVGLDGIHQESMVLTQWAFIGPALLWPRELGLPDNEEGLEGLVAVMGEVGRQLGVREEVNLCNGGLAEAREYARLLHHQIKQHLVHPTHLAEEMAEQLLWGANILNPFIRPAAFRTWALGLLKTKTVNEKELGGPDLFLCRLQGVVLHTGFHVPLLSSILRFLANNLMRLNILLASQWEDVIVSRAENGPLFPSNLNLLEPFLFIPILVSFTLVRCFWESLLVLRLPVVYFTGSILGVMLFLCVQKSGYLA